MKYDRGYFEDRQHSRETKERRQHDFTEFLEFAQSRFPDTDIQKGFRKKCLDVGCAYGYLLELLRRVGYEIYGVDISEHAIAKARSLLHENAVLVVHDVQQSFPFNTRFDLVTCFDVLEHLDVPEKTIQNCYDVLNPKGAFICLTPNKLSPLTLLLKDPTHINVKSEEEWRSLFSTLKWTSIEVFSLQWAPLIWRFSSEHHRFFHLPLIGFNLLVLATK